MIFIQQSGRTRHEHICESLELFAEKVMPAFKASEAEREAKKEAELAPYIAAAMARKKPMPALADKDIPVIEALGRQIAEPGKQQDPAARPQSLGEAVRQDGVGD